MNAITVLLAEDHRIVREGLRELLNLEDGIEVVGEAENGRQAVAFASKLCPDVVVMDVAMPLLNGMEATRQIHTTTPARKVLVLSASSDDAYVEQLMALGASGYLTKQCAAHLLPKAIREVHRGNTFFSASISMRLDRKARRVQDRGEPPAQAADPLTSRETEVLRLIAESKSNRDVAKEIQISIKTVEKHRQNLMGKLDIHDVAGLTRHAIETGVIESSVEVTIL